MGRSIVAIAAGFFFIMILSFGMDAILRAAVPEAFDAAGRTDSVGMLVFSLLYVGVFAITGCYIAARLAPNHPMRHALILGGLGLILNIVGTTVMWDSAPAWYHIIAIAVVMPYAWIGGWLRERQLGRRPSDTRPLAA